MVAGAGRPAPHDASRSRHYNRAVLDIALRHVSYRYPKGTFALRDVSLLFAKQTHTLIAGPAGCGASTLLRLIAGTLRPDHGEVILGARVANAIKASARPLLFATSKLEVPGRWSVEHALINAVRQRTLDRVDRHRELQLALAKWSLAALVARRVDSLSSSEQTLVQLARIELLRPGVALLDRLLEHLNPAAVPALADNLYRTLRVIGTTVISAPATSMELGLTDNLVVLDDGAVVQEGSAAELYAEPRHEATARATGEINVVPVTIRGRTVSSVIGEWELETAPFAGSGVALIRPDDFSIPPPGEESDLIFGVEEASFREGRWHVAGMLTGGVILRVVLPRDARVHKGKLLPLRYDPSRIRLIPREMAALAPTVPTDVIPLLRDSR